jgi:hypothetical protein
LPTQQQVLYTRTNIDTVAFLTADADFAPFAAKLQEHGKIVIGLADAKTRQSKRFASVCNEFESLPDSLLNPSDATLATEPSNSANERQIPLAEFHPNEALLVADSVRMLEEAHGDQWINSDSALSFIRRRQPDFNTTSWRKKLEAHAGLEVWWEEPSSSDDVRSSKSWHIWLQVKRSLQTAPTPASRVSLDCPQEPTGLLCRSPKKKTKLKGVATPKGKKTVFKSPRRSPSTARQRRVKTGDVDAWSSGATLTAKRKRTSESDVLATVKRTRTRESDALAARAKQEHINKNERTATTAAPTPTPTAQKDPKKKARRFSSELELQRKRKLNGVAKPKGKKTVFKSPSPHRTRDRPSKREREKERAKKREAADWALPSLSPKAQRQYSDYMRSSAGNQGYRAGYTPLIWAS